MPGPRRNIYSGKMRLVLLLMSCWRRFSNAQTIVSTQAQLTAAITNGNVITFGANIVLSSTVSISISGSLTIYGNGYQLNGNSNCNCLALGSGTIYIYSLTITNGYGCVTSGATDNGAGVAITGGTVIFTSCSFTNNRMGHCGVRGFIWFTYTSFS